MAQRGGHGFAASGDTFRQMAKPLADELIADLDREHSSEIDYLYNEQLQLRAELARVVQLMQKEVVPREKLMHELFEGMTTAFEHAMGHMDGHMKEYLQKHKEMSLSSFARREALINPMMDMEAGLNRIAEHLGHAAVRPDIQGWSAKGGSGGGGHQASPQRFAGGGGTGSPSGNRGGGGQPAYGATRGGGRQPAYGATGGSSFAGSASSGRGGQFGTGY
eukprot:CAMPEP_0177164782 /NCGR_PEP_ID=MMETSP0367-20130122/7134_1 /TAXON_ID=447022 ORGANISM="Scrippsiella hangoei-like, Strain SHHI-4" /NCGR_SAMPLE_ID=MMETSP0367 /ASSEMBLY_ACC=CAM_ASM_000362 /LENGTH=219 /DNA_ID=CAMNT_0018610707 /DNA_START=68 /DNA_END=727 /DNA_ORIENTATION=-